MHLAAVACERGVDAAVVDASVGPGGLAHLLRVGGVSTVADLAAGAEVEQVVVGPDEVRVAGGVRVPFASVLGPDADQVKEPGSWTAVYERALAHLVERAGLVVVDTPVWWSPSCPGAGLIETGLRHGAALLVVTDASREGVTGARGLAAWGRARTHHVLGVYNTLPSRRLPSLDEAGRSLETASVAAVLPYDETVRLRAARGEVIHPLLRLGASQVLDAVGLGAGR
ncbi:MAG: hypothetical protein Q4C85_07140 [Actinomyces sp.]|nr:hypothetical protein [Actinomyces sp.]